MNISIFPAEDVVTHLGERIVGSVQLDCDTPQNQPHRAEVSKLLVHPNFRGQGHDNVLNP